MKIDLKVENFDKMPGTKKLVERKFLLKVINTVQFIIILLMLGFLFFMMEEKETETDFISNVVYLAENETFVDWVRILDVLGICLIPLLVWLNINSLLAWQSKKSVGVKKYAWGEESLLRDGGDRGTWYFGPAPAK